MHNNKIHFTINGHRLIGTGLIGLLAIALIGCTSPPAKQTETELILGTTVSITTYGRTPDGLFESLFARIQQIEERMSISEDDYTTTELIAVNDAAGTAPVVVSPDTFEVVRQAVSYSRLTDGAFDVTVQPLVALWGIGTASEGVPSPEAIEAALAAVDYSRVVLDANDRSIYLPRETMGIDVGGIAKGYAADEVARMLRDAGVDSALLDFGGNILTIGTKPDDSPWRIGVQVPDASRGSYLGIAEVVNQTVVTSGTYERYFVQDGVRYHHILDTETGYPVQNGLGSVTIITEESIRADALSTALFAMGLDEGLDFVEGLEDAEALFVTNDQRVYMTSGMATYFTLTNEEFTLAGR